MRKLINTIIGLEPLYHGNRFGGLTYSTHWNILTTINGVAAKLLDSWIIDAVDQYQCDCDIVDRHPRGFSIPCHKAILMAPYCTGGMN